MPTLIPELIPQIEEIQAQGATVLLKWDGERKSNRCSVVVLHQETDFVWRKDCDAVEVALSEGIENYKAHLKHRAS